MKVTDNVTVQVRTRKGVKHLPIEITLLPERNAVQVKYRGFKRAALLNGMKVREFGTYPMVLEFLDYFFGEYMGYGPCNVII